MEQGMVPEAGTCSPGACAAGPTTGRGRAVAGLQDPSPRGPAGLPLSASPSLLILVRALPQQRNSPHGTPGTSAGMPLPVKAGDNKDCCLQPLSLVCGLLSDDSS